MDENYTKWVEFKLKQALMWLQKLEKHSKGRTDYCIKCDAYIADKLEGYYDWRSSLNQAKRKWKRGNDYVPTEREA